MPVVVSGPDGLERHPGIAVTPILLERGPGVFSVVGTGFYVTRYGLFLTAKHVVEALVAGDGRTLRKAYAWQLSDEPAMCLRQIRTVTFEPRSPCDYPDIAVCQADNFLEKVPDRPIMNERIALDLAVPASGAPIATYAFPENPELDFNDRATPPLLRARFFEGVMEEEVGDHPHLRYPHFRSTMSVLSGASGGPTFAASGNAFAVNCLGMELLDGDHLSSLVPVAGFLALPVPMTFLPPQSWEYSAIPEHRRGKPLTGQELVEYGHVTLAHDS